MHPLVIELINLIYKNSCLDLQVGVIRKVEPMLGSVNPKGNQIGEEINFMESYHSNSIANSLKPPLKLDIAKDLNAYGVERGNGKRY